MTTLILFYYVQCFPKYCIDEFQYCPAIEIWESGADIYARCKGGYFLYCEGERIAKDVVECGGPVTYGQMRSSEVD